MKPDSIESFRKYMNQYEFDEDWDEVIDLLSAVGLLNAYLHMCSIEIKVNQPGELETTAIRFGDVFRCDDDSCLSWIPITIFKYYNISPLVAHALLDRSLAKFVMNESGIEFLYSYVPVQQELFTANQPIKKARLDADSSSRMQHKSISRDG